MNLQYLFLIAMALSLDAFGVALSIGLNKQAHVKYKFKCAVAFGVFQFLFSLIGSYAGFLFTRYVASVPQVIGGGIISVVGILMIKEGFQKKEESSLIKPGMWIILGISVSIDAMVVGFTAFNHITNNILRINYTLAIGVITLIMSIFAFFISKYLKEIKVIEKYANYIGGIILVVFGINMMFF